MRKILFALLLLNVKVHAQKASLDMLFEMAEKNNYSFKNTELQRELAVITKKIAAVNVFNPKVPLSYQALDNVALQRMFVPGPIFGQPEGTFKELVMGQKYVSTFSVQPQFDIVNLANISQKKLAALHVEDARNSSLQAKRDLFLQVNSTFQTIISYQNQEKVLEENRKVALHILQIIENRQKEGIARVQEVNEAKVNLLTLEDNIYQLQQNTKLQYDLLKILTHAESDLELAEEVPVSELVDVRSSLDYTQSLGRRAIAAQDYFAAKRDQFPVLSFVSSFNWQNLSSSFFYGAGSNAIHFAYVGLKLNWDFPTNIQKVSTVKSKEIQLKIAENQLKEAEDKQNQSNNQLKIDFQKAKTQVKNLTDIEMLRRDTFLKNKLQFEEGVLALDKLLISQNDLLVSQLNLASAKANLKYVSENIRINNLF